MKRILLVLLLASPWMGTACLEADPERDPSICFHQAYLWATEEKFDKTSVYFTDEILDTLKKDPEMTMKKLWAPRLNDGAVKAFKAIEQDRKDDRYTIKFMLILATGEMTDAEDGMVMVNGKWKFDKIQRVR
jgi:hypothetical protein